MVTKKVVVLWHVDAGVTMDPNAAGFVADDRAVVVKLPYAVAVWVNSKV
jgi:hypothetical protein